MTTTEIDDQNVCSDNGSEYEDMYDTLPAGTIPEMAGDTDTVVPYIGRKNKNPVPNTYDEGINPFSTSKTKRRGSGGRGTFLRYGTDYVKAMDRRYAPLTKEALVRRYRRMDKDAYYLYKQGIIDNLSPNTMTMDDVHNYLAYRMNLKVTDSEMDHEIAAMKSVFEYCGNGAVHQALARYPYLRPKGRTQRLPTLSNEVVDRIMEFAMAQDDEDWMRMKAYGIVVWALATGMRSKEMRLCNIDDVKIDGSTWTANVMHPKGEGTYGEPRVTIIHPQMHAFMLRYLKARRAYVDSSGFAYRALFPGGKMDGGYMQGNTLRRLKDIVSEDIGFDFDLRICRRTFAQRLIDTGVDIETVSVLMGHKTTATTEGSYGRLKGEMAVGKASNLISSRSELDGLLR